MSIHRTPRSSRPTRRLTISNLIKNMSMPGTLPSKSKRTRWRKTGARPSNAKPNGDSKMADDPKAAAPRTAPELPADFVETFPEAEQRQTTPNEDWKDMIQFDRAARE